LPAGFLFPFYPPSVGRITIEGTGSRLQVDGLMRLGMLGIAELEVGVGCSMTVGGDMLLLPMPSTVVRVGIGGDIGGGGGSGSGGPIIDIGGVLASSTIAAPAYVIEIFADEAAPPKVGDSFVAIEATTIALPPTIGLPEISGVLLTSFVETVDGRQRLVVAVLGSPDLNGDGVVDGADLGALLAQWGPCDGCNADLNGDGVVDGADLGILLANWTIAR